MRIVIVDKEKNFMFATLKVIPPSCESFNTSQKLIIISFKLKLRIKSMPLELDFRKFALYFWR